MSTIEPRYLSGADAEAIVFWHRGLSTTDIAVGRALLQAADERGLGTRLPYR